MEKIIITATAESIEQVEQLLEAGVDRIYVGEKDFGLRLPTTFSYEELRTIAKLVHEAGKELIVAVNALMHQDMMDRIKPFLDFLEEIKTDYITVGDAGVFYVVNRDGYSFKTIYDASTMVTSMTTSSGMTMSTDTRDSPRSDLRPLRNFLIIFAAPPGTFSTRYSTPQYHNKKDPLIITRGSFRCVWGLLTKPCFLLGGVAYVNARNWSTSLRRRLISSM